MNISSDNLLQLKCSECDCFLSRIPIYLKEDGSAICGRCPIPQPDTESAASDSEEQIQVYRMKPFEKLIRNIKFPCMYQNNGCAEVMLSLNLQNHEEHCKFRPYVCPILPIGTCDWIGCQDKFYEHCQTKHSERILENPCVFVHDIAENCTKSYVMKAFNNLFLIHTKVCLISHKIYHSVHCFDYVPNMSNMYFKLVIRKGYEKVVKRGKIQPVECKTIKENLSVSCGINSLLEIFDGLDETNFTIKLICSSSCIICNLFTNDLVEDRYCHDCDKTRRSCKFSNRGCTYQDIDIKTFIHEKCLCRFTNWCWICEIRRDDSPTLTKHYETAHEAVIFNDLVFWNITEKMFTNNQFDFIIVSKYDKFFCTLYYIKHICLIEVFSSTLNTEELNKLKCVVSIKNNSLIKEFDIEFFVEHKLDWRDTFTEYDLFANNSSYQIKIDILKKNN